MSLPRASKKKKVPHGLRAQVKSASSFSSDKKINRRGGAYCQKYQQLHGSVRRPATLQHPAASSAALRMLLGYACARVRATATTRHMPHTSTSLVHLQKSTSGSGRKHGGKGIISTWYMVGALLRSNFPTIAAEPPLLSYTRKKYYKTLF